MNDSSDEPPPIHEPPELERPAAFIATEKELDEQLPVSARRGDRDPYAAWRHRDYSLYSVGSFIASMGAQLQSVTIGYELAQRAGDARSAAFILGLVSLVQALPVMGLALPAGHLADQFDRRRIVLIGLLFTAAGSIVLAWLSLTQHSLPFIYGCLFFIATAQALMRPAQQALVPQLVPSEVLPNAMTWSSTRWQIASVAGPALFGPALLLLKNPAWIYLLDGVAMMSFFAFLLFVRAQPRQRDGEPMTWASVLVGARFVWNSPLILATITLDMFAVLLGGAVVLLPVYAEHILYVDATGLGWLRAAPAIGALIMAVSIAYMPPMQRAGKVLLWSVMGFGAATIVFGFSRNFWLSMLALFFTGAFDAVSVVVRHTLVQLLTPDAMRGRVSAVNSVFISASNELGGFESGVAARFLGLVTAVVAGGVGTIIVVAATALKWPQVKQLGALEDVEEMKQ